ncbi:hypothetical protein BDV96DRAFT_665978 [Lophiotrema nucula]|uniref:Peptidase M20 dimerisation domain-containing protein n=1 Tax=Lophiotrema nucula TaxID=690887 RepID=A0A6A5YZ98_9PLEO|nr:hypothetical protein BDV96DRAFT_665978 [Lophiotrema nucula]
MGALDRGARTILYSRLTRPISLPVKLQQFRASGKQAQLVSKYRLYINQFADLSQQESRTIKLAVKYLNKEGFEVFEGIGRYSAVGVLRNGPGKTVLLRADMDALPIQEETDVPYASQTRMIDVVDGQAKSVMHACGHDMYTTSLIAAASCLSAARADWLGTLICLFQPDEEVDILFAQHVWPLHAGSVSVLLGPVFSTVDNFRVRVFSEGGYTSRPDCCVDPTVLTSHMISVAVVTCGSIYGGSASNIIPGFVEFTLSVRSYKPDVCSRELEPIRRVMKTESEASGLPREPEIERTDEALPVINDHQLTSAREALSNTPSALIEDFPYLACDDIPYVYWTVGCIDHCTWDSAKSDNRLDTLPGLHSAKFLPSIDPTLQRGADLLSIAALTFLDTDVKW